MGDGERLDLLRGTLDMLVLRILEEGPAHGYGIARRIEAVTDDALSVEEGSLYPSLYRMQRRGWIESSWGRTDTNRRAKFYRLTPEGREQLAGELSRWSEFSAAVGKVIARGEG